MGGKLLTPDLHDVCLSIISREEFIYWVLTGMSPSLQFKTARPRTGDCAVQGKKRAADWAVLDWGTADWADWVILLQSGLEITSANKTCWIPDNLWVTGIFVI